MATVEQTMIEISASLTEHARQTIERLDLTGAFKADVPRVELPLEPCDETARAVSERQKTDPTYVHPHEILGPPAEPEQCSCDEALSLRARLSLAARGNVALHLFREDGLWHVESWRDGEMTESYVGVPSVAEALDRIGAWMRGA